MYLSIYLSTYPILSYPILSHPSIYLSYPILSYPIPSIYLSISIYGWGRPRVFFRFPGDFFSGYGVYIAKHIRPEAATMRKGFAPLPFYLFCCFFCVLGFFFDSVAGRVVCLFHGANRCIPWLPFIFQSFKRFLGV